MPFRYLRFSLFHRFLPAVSLFFRKRRMAAFIRFLEQSGIQDPKILDVGGSVNLWQVVETPLNITILNLSHSLHQSSSHHCVSYRVGNGCNMAEIKDNQYDVVFSNSVIEHVGNQTKQQQFASEVLRVGRYFWVQTPSKWFPIEAHTGMPFWWFYPESWQHFFIRRWKQKKLFKWSEMVEETTFLEKNYFKSLFPHPRLLTERFLGIPKSYIVYSDLAKKSTTDALKLSGSTR
jgi:hypothetical protein